MRTNKKNLTITCSDATCVITASHNMGNVLLELTENHHIFWRDSIYRKRLCAEKYSEENIWLCKLFYCPHVKPSRNEGFKVSQALRYERRKRGRKEIPTDKKTEECDLIALMSGT